MNPAIREQSIIKTKTQQTGEAEIHRAAQISFVVGDRRSDPILACETRAAGHGLKTTSAFFLNSNFDFNWFHFNFKITSERKFFLFKNWLLLQQFRL